jgi:hypothetical protein
MILSNLHVIHFVYGYCRLLFIVGSAQTTFLHRFNPCAAMSIITFIPYAEEVEQDAAAIKYICSLQTQNERDATEKELQSLAKKRPEFVRKLISYFPLVFSKAADAGRRALTSNHTRTIVVVSVFFCLVLCDR